MLAHRLRFRQDFSILVIDEAALNTSTDTLSQIRSLTSDENILAFADFVISARGKRRFAAHDSLDLMTIPRLVPQIFIADFRNGMDNGILIKFSGSHIDEYFGRNIQGKYLDDVYNGRDGLDFVREVYRRCHVNGQICFRRKSTSFNHRIFGERDVLQTFLLIPCSTDDQVVDYGIGYAIYSDKIDNPEDTLVFI